MQGDNQMDYEEFKQAIEATGCYISTLYLDSGDDIEYIGHSWVTGGQAGGSCWGTEPRAVTGEAEPEFDYLDKVVIALTPKLALGEYLKLKQLIRVEERSSREYYGNHTDRAYRFIDVVKLYEALKLHLE